MHAVLQQMEADGKIGRWGLRYVFDEDYINGLKQAGALEAHMASKREKVVEALVRKLIEEGAVRCTESDESGWELTAEIDVLLPGWGKENETVNTGD